MSEQLPATKIWSIPVILAVFSVVGLFAALFSDGLWDVVSWIALSLPCGVIVWYVWLGRIHEKNVRNSTST